jgi:hypothetical protein
MINNRGKSKKSIELFREKSGEVVRTIRFKNQKEFEYFLSGYNSMRYPGYKWRDCKSNLRE